jgi:hypothetical protein
MNDGILLFRGRQVYALSLRIEKACTYLRPCTPPPGKHRFHARSFLMFSVAAGSALLCAPNAVSLYIPPAGEAVGVVSTARVQRGPSEAARCASTETIPTASPLPSETARDMSAADYLPSSHF